MKIDRGNIYRLKGTVQHYAWGGFEFIPQLIGADNTEKKPFAEYWMGAHTSSPSVLTDGQTEIALDRLLASQPGLMGEEIAGKFNQLPYLLKILDVKEMLSIQVHPSKEAAKKGFDAEEERGISIDAPHRNYKDSNHKPEVMIALSDFWLLHGFKKEDSLIATLNQVPELRSLVPVFHESGYQGLYSHVMELPQQEVDKMLSSLVQKEVRRRSFHDSEPDDPGYWVGEYYLNKKAPYIDRGVFAIYMLNIVHLEKGQAIFQAAGVPHAYLKGQNVELMANSDNVLRGGLTNKHIDVTELVKHTKFEAVSPEILQGISNGPEKSFCFPVEDFAICELTLSNNDQYSTTAKSAEIIVCIEGSGTLTAANSLTLKRGDACIVFAGTTYTLTTDRQGDFYRATAG